MQNKLTGIPETLLIPLWARAHETERDESIIKDYPAVNMVSAIDYDFQKFRKAWLSQLGVSVRTLLLDNAVHRFLRSHPGAIVINLGAGLDTRCERLRYDDCRCWYDLDVPKVIELRRTFFPENERHNLLSYSMFDTSWLDEVDHHGEPVLILAEGLFMYFEEAELRPLFDRLIDRFPGAEMLFEMLPPIMVGRARHHDSLPRIDNKLEFKWGLKNSRKLESWNPAIRFLEEWNYYEIFKKRWKWFGVIGRLPILRPWFACRIVRLRFEGGR